MRLRVGTWNVHGGYAVASPTSTPVRVRPAHAAQLITRHQLDVVAFQEVEVENGTASSSWLNSVCELADLDHVKFVPIERSHHSVEHRLGLAIATRLPIESSDIVVFDNPGLDGFIDTIGRVTSHDKGLMTVRVLWDALPLQVATTHLLPFRHFNASPEDHYFETVWKALSATLSDTSVPTILAGDFNAPTRTTLIEGNELTFAFAGQATRTSGESHDDVVASRHLRLIRADTTPTFSDHFLCSTTWERVPP